MGSSSPENENERGGWRVVLSEGCVESGESWKSNIMKRVCEEF